MIRIYKIYLQDAASLLVDETADALHAAAARETPNGRLRNALNVVAQHFTVTLRAALSETFTALSASRHN